jgi:redox-sensitive bicupin YhaK (pirin superfamily)
VHLLQIWIEPSATGIAPGYEQKTIPDADKRGRLRLIAAPDGRGGSVTIHQDARIFASVLEAGDKVEHAAPGRRLWLQVARGAVTANGQWLGQGDGAAIVDERALVIAGVEPAEIILFDLP